MSKAVLISIKPEWCEKITECKKYDFRKTRPYIPTPFKAYIYMTKGMATYWTSGHIKCVNDGGMNVIGEFVCDRVETLVRVGFSGSREEPKYRACNLLDMSTKPIDGILTDGCLSLPELETYLAGAVGYAWHISELKIYDKPKELSEFYTSGTLSNEDFLGTLYDGSGDPTRMNYASYLFTRRLRRPPQSWCYVEELT